MDVDTILAGLTPNRPLGALERWEAANPQRSADFWRLVEGAQRKGVGLAVALQAWDANVDAPDDRCPVKQNQVRLALRKREQTA